MFGQTITVLNQMVADGIIRRYAIGGAVAAMNYLEPALTEDVDVLISFDTQSPSGPVTLGPIVAWLGAKCYSEWRKEGLVVDGWPVQFLPVADPLDLEAIEQAAVVEDPFGTEATISTWMLSAEHVVATALKTGCPKDFVRISAFLDTEAVDLDLLGDILDRHGLGDKWVSFCQKTGRTDPLAEGMAS